MIGAMPGFGNSLLATRRTALPRVSEVLEAQASSTSANSGARLGGRRSMASLAASSASVHHSGPAAASCSRNWRRARCGSDGASSNTLQASKTVAQFQREDT